MSASNYGVINTRSRGKIRKPMPANQPFRNNSCKMCNMPENNEMVQCDECNSWFHFICVNVDQSIAERPWNCQNCDNLIPENIVCDATSARSSIGTQISRRSQLQFQMLAEERALQEKRDQEYLKKKYNLLQNLEFEQDPQLENVQQERTEEWLSQNASNLNNTQLNVFHQVVPEDTRVGPGLNNRGEISGNNVHMNSNLQATVTSNTIVQNRNYPSPLISQTQPVISSCVGQFPADQNISHGPILHGPILPTQFVQPPVNNYGNPMGHSNQGTQFPIRNIAAAPLTGNFGQSNTMTYPNNAPAFCQSNIIPNVINSNRILDNVACQNNRQCYNAPILDKNQIAARTVMPKDLPNFNGSPDDWPLFFSCYEGTTVACGFTNQENLIRLQKSLKGRALEAVRSRLLLPSNVPAIIETLKMLFGRPEMIIQRLLKTIRDEPAPRQDRLETLVSYSLSVQNLVAVIESSGMEAHLNNPALLHDLVEKLPAQIRLNWSLYMQSIPVVSISTFNVWLSHMAKAASAVVDFPEVKLERRPKEKGFLNFHESGNGSPLVSGQSQLERGTWCPICKDGSHFVDVCKVFKEMSRSERWVSVKKFKLCRRCLRRHYPGRCTMDKECGINGCTFRHHRLLHNENKDQVVDMSLRKPSVNAHIGLNNHLQSNSGVLFRVIPVVIYGNNCSLKTFAFLDDGSSVTLIEEEIVKKLDISGPNIPMVLKWTGDTHRVEEESLRVSLNISGTKSQARKYQMQGVHTVKSLGLPSQSILADNLRREFGYLKGIDFDSYQSVTPRILIGLDNLKLTIPLKVKDGRGDQPVATKTRLGWVVCGNLKNSPSDAIYNATLNLHYCECGNSQDENLQRQLKEYFSLESFGTTKPTLSLESAETKRANEILENSTRYLGDRFETGLLWKYNTIEFPDSLPMAMQRMRCLNNKMSREPDLADKLRKTIQEYLAKGYIRQLSPEELAERFDRTWYLPIFTVNNKPGKVRIVWDAAAKVDGICLNDMLLKGPDLLSPLPKVLNRFRQRKFAINADIKEMFHQIRIRSEDQQSQRFLWRENENSKPVVYAMNVMTFGATCSPASAQYVKNFNALQYQNDYPKAVSSITESHYVDDLLDSCNTEEEAIKLMKEIVHIHKKGGFEIRNWVSNSKLLLKEAGESAKPNPKDLNITAEEHTEKVLGMWWNPTSDTFSFVLKVNDKNREVLSGQRPPTKREVLRTLMSVYDPLGLIAHYLIYLKVLLQEIWRSDIGWDEVLTTEQNGKWLNWLGLFPKIQELKIPRCYTHEIRSVDEAHIELHLFVDASEEAYAAVAYFRIELLDVVECVLLEAKTKVAPLKALSIPRLELEAATLGARLASSIKQRHCLNIRKTYFWSDSKTVLSWLRSDHRRYKQFVAFRVGEILESTDSHDWRWIPTKLNVADDATKWSKTPDLVPNSRWYTGPEFLYKSQDQWPQDLPNEETKLEIRPHLLFHSISIQPVINYERFSSWDKLLRTQAYILRFIENMRRNMSSVAKLSGPLHQNELNLAENLLFRQVQFEAFPDEITILKNKIGIISKKSSIYKESPYLDENNVLRSHGRIDLATNVSFSVKRPILLPKRHYLTCLIIRHYHIKYRHHNFETIINEIRQRFIIPSLRALLKHERRYCPMCKILSASSRPPKMAELPLARLDSFTRPFTYVGIDYFGPILVKIGRTRSEKRWVMLITCLTIRAIHIEICNSLDTSSCIINLRNFMARRGIPRAIYSDNGSNFHATERELKGELRNLDKEKIYREFASITTEWHFNPPSAPHMGGSWERMIRSVKKSLRIMLCERHPTEEVLRGTLMEIENMINSRPLTFVSLENDAQEALTPNHFLLGTSNGIKPMGDPQDNAMVLRKHWLKIQALANLFWKRWVNEYLPTISRRSKWFESVPELKEGDIVLIVDSDNPRNLWPKGRILKVVRSKDGQVRRATVQTKTGIYERPAIKLALIDIRSEE